MNLFSPTSQISLFDGGVSIWHFILIFTQKNVRKPTFFQFLQITKGTLSSGAKNLTFFSVFTQKMSDVRSKCPLFFTFPFVFFSNRYMITCKNKLFIEPGILVFQKAWIFPVLKLPLSLLSWARSVFLSTFVTFFSSWNALEF